MLISLFSLFSCSRDAWNPCKQQLNLETRFVLLQGQRELTNGQFIPVVLRMNAISGETWVLSTGSSIKWEPVQDALSQVYIKDPKTNKWGLGIKLPDGRDISELSKEELIRLVRSMAQTQQIVNPNDPLGIRNKDKTEK